MTWQRCFNKTGKPLATTRQGSIVLKKRLLANFCIKDEFIISEGISDYQILTEYITRILGGNLSKKYAKTEGRIVVK